MFRNNLILSLRTLTKFKGYSLINLASLSLGLAAGVLIMIYVFDELSFDDFHPKGSRIYRVETAFGTEGLNETNGWPIGSILRNEFPEVEAVMYSRSSSNFLLNYQGKRIQEKSIFATPEFFELFSFRLAEGDPALALKAPFSIVLSKKLEKKYFGDQPALNKTIRLADTLDFLVTGVMDNMPSNSHIQQDAILSFSTYEKLTPSFRYDDGWGNLNVHNYILLKEKTDPTAFAGKVKNLYMDRVGDQMKKWGVNAQIVLTPLREVYFKKNAGNSMGPAGSKDRVYLVSGIALLVILLACINFVNLATARSVHRAKEVGLRKLVGSSRLALIAQFLSESFLITMLAFIVAVGLIALALPMFNELLAKSYEWSSFLTVPIMAGAACIILVISFLSGYYPALVMSALNPVQVLKGKLQSSERGIQLRRALVIFQFVISVSLVAGTFIVLNQLEFMQKESLGFAKNEILVINAARVNAATPNSFPLFRDELKTRSQISDVALANAIPGHQGWNGQVAYPEGHEGEVVVSTEYIAADENYVPTLGLTIIAGRNFDILRETDKKNGLVVNETTVHQMGWSSPQDAIGKKITSPSGFPAGEVIGVVRNYHQMGLQQVIGPIVIDYNPGSAYLFAIRYKAANTKELIKVLQTKWKAEFPSDDFNYFILDADFERQYQTEERLSNVFTLFSIITIVIAVIGLFGLVSFMTVTRTKEIGVRKVLGASPMSITQLLSREFIVLVLAADLIALPLAWYAAGKWLENFAFRMTLTPWIFISTGLIALVISLAAVSFQTIRAALVNPVTSLRYE